MCEKCFFLQEQIPDPWNLRYLKLLFAQDEIAGQGPLETKGTGSILVVEAPLNVHRARGTKGILPENMWTIPRNHRMFGSGQDTICRWLSSLLSTTQWVCCPFCEPANDIPWKRSHFWGLKFAGVFKRAFCDMLCMAERTFKAFCFLAIWHFFPNSLQALAVCQRKGLRPRLSIAPESPQVMQSC